jgi:hypothetical protein
MRRGLYGNSGEFPAFSGRQCLFLLRGKDRRGPQPRDLDRSRQDTKNSAHAHGTTSPIRKNATIETQFRGADQFRGPKRQKRGKERLTTGCAGSGRRKKFPKRFVK